VGGCECGGFGAWNERRRRQSPIEGKGVKDMNAIRQDIAERGTHGTFGEVEQTGGKKKEILSNEPRRVTKKRGECTVTKSFPKRHWA
jgi:hypothetical protein